MLLQKEPPRDTRHILRETLVMLSLLTSIKEMKEDVTLIYVKQTRLRNRLDTLLKPALGKIYDTNAPCFRRNESLDIAEPVRVYNPAAFSSGEVGAARRQAVPGSPLLKEAALCTIVSRSISRRSPRGNGNRQSCVHSMSCCIGFSSTG